jgi:general nucleoside transport system permease protein
VRIERRLRQPRYITVLVPVCSLAVAFLLGALLLAITGHEPVSSYRRLFDSAFVRPHALTGTLTTATPLVFTGLAAAFAFRMNLFNIGGEGQLYMGAIGAAGVGLAIGDGDPALSVVAMIVAGAIAGALWAFIPGVLRAFANTNEIIVSLMLNYVAGLFLTYLIFDSESYWRDTTTPDAKVFPQGKTLPGAATWPHFQLSNDFVVALGFYLAVAIAIGVWAVWNHTRFGFEMQVIGDSPRAARYAGMRTRRKILAVMAISGAIAGLGGASQVGDFRHLLDARGLQQPGFGYTGIVIAALARYNPFGVVIVAVLLGGLTNAGYELQGADFPSGLVGVLQGLILFCALGGELFVRYRVTFGRRAAAAQEAAV